MSSPKTPVAISRQKALAAAKRFYHKTRTRKPMPAQASLGQSSLGQSSLGQSSLGQIPTPETYEHDIRRTMLLGGGIAFVFVFGFGGWAATAPLNSAIVAPGKVAVESHVKTVQHQEGGIVRKIFVRNGQSVAALEPLIALDDQRAEAEVKILNGRLFEQKIRQARLIAQNNGKTALVLPGTLKSAIKDSPRLAAYADLQGTLLQNQQDMHQAQKKQLTERIGQYKQEIKGLERQVSATRKDIAILVKDIIGLKRLKRKKLLRRSRLSTARRDQVRQTGELGRLTARISQLLGMISETRMKLIEMQKAAHSTTFDSLEQLDAQIAETHEKYLAAKDRRQRLIIRAPQAGRVHDLQMFTEGGVISPGATVMQIVPMKDELIITGEVGLNDIDALSQNMPVRVRLSSLNQRTTPELPGRVISLGPGQSQDQNGQREFYKIEVRLEKGAMLMLKDERHKIRPGMPAELYVLTKPQTLLSYLIRPLADQFARAFREQ